MFLHVLAGGERGGLGEEVIRISRVQGFVVNVGRRVEGGFGSGHLEEKVKRERRKEERRGFRRSDGVAQ